METKENMVVLELTSSDGKVERKEVALEHAQNLLRLSLQRGWSWRLPADSPFGFDTTTNTIYRLTGNEAKKTASKGLKKSTKKK